LPLLPLLVLTSSLLQPPPSLHTHRCYCSRRRYWPDRTRPGVWTLSIRQKSNSARWAAC